MMTRLVFDSIFVLLMIGAIAACAENSSSTGPAPHEPLSSSNTRVEDAEFNASDPSQGSESADFNALSDPDQADITQTEASTVQGTSILFSGHFVSAEHPTHGTARIVYENQQYYIELSRDFQTDLGPDLLVILHRSTDVVSSTTPPDFPIEEGDYVAIAPLQQERGFQRYPIADTVNLNDYSSVAIWCRQFNTTFGSASLR